MGILLANLCGGIANAFNKYKSNISSTVYGVVTPSKQNLVFIGYKNKIHWNSIDKTARWMEESDIPGVILVPTVDDALFLRDLYSSFYVVSAGEVADNIILCKHVIASIAPDPTSAEMLELTNDLLELSTYYNTEYVFASFNLPLPEKLSRIFLTDTVRYCITSNSTTDIKFIANLASTLSCLVSTGVNGDDALKISSIYGVNRAIGMLSNNNTHHHGFGQAEIENPISRVITSNFLPYSKAAILYPSHTIIVGCLFVI